MVWYYKIGWCRMGRKSCRRKRSDFIQTKVERQKKLFLFVVVLLFYLLVIALSIIDKIKIALMMMVVVIEMLNNSFTVFISIVSSSLEMVAICVIRAQLAGYTVKFQNLGIFFQYSIISHPDFAVELFLFFLFPDSLQLA